MLHPLLSPPRAACARRPRPPQLRAPQSPALPAPAAVPSAPGTTFIAARCLPSHGGGKVGSQETLPHAPTPGRWGGLGAGADASHPGTPAVPGSAPLPSPPCQRRGQPGSAGQSHRCREHAEPAGCAGAAGREQVTRRAQRGHGGGAFGGNRAGRAGHGVGGSAPLPLPCASRLTPEHGAREGGIPAPCA